MFCKLCPICDQKSFSSASKREWICPYCGVDITNETVFLPQPGSTDENREEQAVADYLAENGT